MNLPPESKLLLDAASAIVPAAQRADWRREWLAEIWWWMEGQPDAGRAPAERVQLAYRCLGAFSDAFQLRMEEMDLAPRVAQVVGGPWFCLAGFGFLIAALALASGGFRHTRRALTGAPFPAAGRLAVLAQSVPFMGGRYGVPAATVAYWNETAHDIEGAAVYVAYHSVAATPFAGPHEVAGAKVGPGFFSILGVPGVPKQLCGDCVVLGYDFWKSELHGDRYITGKIISVDGQPMRVAGVLPRRFWFLDSRPAVWSAYDPATTWPGYPNPLMGAICRVKPGVSPASARTELRTLASRVQPRRSGIFVDLESLDQIAQRPVTILAPIWIVFLGLAFAGSGIARSWFAAAKSTLGLILVLLSAMELGGSGFGTTASGNDLTAGIAPLWLLSVGSLLVLGWSWSDQRKRCRTCLCRLSMPVHIGSGARMLLEEAGTEVVCANGHGTLFTSDGIEQPETRWHELDGSWQDIFAEAGKE